MKRNPHDFRNALEMGQAAEERFKDMAEALGWDVRKATRYQDSVEHWDFMIKKFVNLDTPDMMRLMASKVEVKARKRIGSKDHAAQDEWIWIELHGVRKDDPGWLNGQADVIAFEQFDHFILVYRKELKDLVDRLILTQPIMNWNTTNMERAAMVTQAGAAEYRAYQRPGRKYERIAMIMARDLFRIRFRIWR